MLMEEKIIVENILSREHIDELYNLFTDFVDSNSGKMTPLNFIKVFANFSQRRNLQIDKEYWSQLFIQIDSDKDGGINFQDFLKYVYNNLKLIFGELGDKLSLSKINLTTKQEKNEFHLVVITIFFRSIINPFKLVGLSRNIQPVYFNLVYNHRKNGGMKNLFDGDSNEMALKWTLSNLQSNAISQINYGLINFQFEVIYDSICKLNKLLTSFNLVTNSFEICNYLTQIRFILNLIIISGIIDRLIFFLNSDVDVSNASAFVRIIKIFRKLIHISTHVINLYTFSRSNEMKVNGVGDNDLKTLKEYFDDLINKILPRLNYFFEINDLEINHNAYLLALIIAKKDTFYLNAIVSQTGLINNIMNKIDYLLSSQFSFFINRNINFDQSVELLKCLFYSLQITYLATAVKDSYSSYYEVINSVLNKMLNIAEKLKEVFYTSENYFKFYYLLLAGLLTRKMNFDDRTFLFKAQEIVSKDIGFFARSYVFYIKNLLLSRVKRDSLILIAEAKTLDCLFNFVDCNKKEEFLVSEFLNLLEIIVDEHKCNLITSSLLRDLMYIFHRLLTMFSQSVTKKVVVMLKSLVDLKEPIVDNLILESEIVYYVCKAVLDYKVKNDFSSELYETNKVYYDTLLVGEILVFLTNLVQCDLIKSNTKYFKNFNLQNLSLITDLFNSLYKYYIPNSEEEGNENEEIYIFDKYRELVNFNLLTAVIELFDICHSYCETFLLNSSLTRDKTELNQIQILSNYLGNAIRDMRESYRKLEEVNTSLECLYDTNVDELFIYVQSKNENIIQVWTTFKFKTEDLTFYHIFGTIEKHYNSELTFYYLDETDNLYKKIKDEADFMEILLSVSEEARSLKKPTIYLKIFVDDSSKSKKSKLLSTCLNCGIKFEIEEKELSKNETSQFCETCKNHLLNQLVTSFSLNSSRGSPFKNFIPYSSIYNDK